MATQKAFKIRSVTPSFRRAGMLFSHEPIEIKASDLTDNQIKALASEPNLVVVEFEQPLDGAPKDQSDEVKIASLVDLIGHMDIDDKAMWTNGGKPQTAALEEMHGGSVSAKERDVAWEMYQAQQGDGAE